MLSNLVRTAAVICAVTLCSGQSARAQTVTGVWPAPSSDEHELKVDSLITSAERLIGDRKFAAARSLYRMAAQLELGAGALPATPLRALASAYYFDRQHERGAEVLEELAELAGPYGDIVVEAEAHLDAGWLRLQAGDRAGVQQRLNAVRLLLRSPYMPESDRQRLTARIR